MILDLQLTSRRMTTTANSRYAHAQARGKKGKRLAAANGTPIPLHGEKVLKFFTNEGHQLSWLFISGKAEKTLKAVSTTCDAGNSVLFTKWGGYVINDKTHKYMEFERTGNTYGQGVWVPANGKFSEDKDFARQVMIR